MQNDIGNTRFKAVAETLRGEDFPMDKHDIDYAIGDLELEGPRGELTLVRDLTDQLEKESYCSAEEVVRSLQVVLHSRNSEAA